MTPQELMENFSLFTDWEDKYRYLIELGDKMEPFPKKDKNDQHKVEGCQSQVWITHHKEGEKFYFQATSDAHIVRGLEAILLILINGKTAKEIQQLDIVSIFNQLGLQEHLSPSRRNGFSAMTNRILALTLSDQ